MRQGSPLFPEGEQYDAIKARDGLEKLCEDETAAVNGALSLEFSLPAHAVSYLVIE